MPKIPEIMASIGPTLESVEDLRQAIRAGARWLRLPCGYRQRPHLENARAVRQAAADCGVQVKLLLDLPSSRPRTGTMEDLRLEFGARVVFWDSHDLASAPAQPGFATVPLPKLRASLKKLSAGQRLWFLDGRLEFVVEKVRDCWAVARLVRGDVPLKTSNAMTMPDSPQPYAMVTDEDRELLSQFAAAGLRPDWIALSLVSSAEDVHAGRSHVAESFGGEVSVMAKFETAAAVAEAEAILAAADGMMVARGDLAPAVGFHAMPEVQEALVAAAQRANKTAVVATQMLETFAATGVPLRAELSDLAVAARQGPDVVMLGKETVYSPRPIESIRFALRVLEHEANRLEAGRTRWLRRAAESSERPFLIAVEGPNGVGKTHVAALMSARLGCPCLRGVPEAWEEPAMKMRMIRDADWLASAMYFLSGVIEGARRATAASASAVVLDRSLWSTLAVHYAHDPDRLDVLMPAAELAAARIRLPNLTIVLEASPSTCQARIARKAHGEQALDATTPHGQQFHQREREFYRWLASQAPAVEFVDTEGRDPEEVCEKVVEIVRKRLPC